MRILCDTNILGELARPKPSSGVLVWSQTVTQIALSAVTLEEIEFGLSWKPNACIEKWFERFVADFCGIVPVTTEIAAYAGRLRGKFQAAGESRSQADMLIAATAAVHKFTLVTRNTRDFEGCHIRLLNPFS